MEELLLRRRRAPPSLSVLFSINILRNVIEAGEKVSHLPSVIVIPMGDVATDKHLQMYLDNARPKVKNGRE